MDDVSERPVLHIQRHNPCGSNLGEDRKMISGYFECRAEPYPNGWNGLRISMKGDVAGFNFLPELRSVANENTPMLNEIIRVIEQEVYQKKQQEGAK